MLWPREVLVRVNFMTIVANIGCKYDNTFNVTQNTWT